MITGVGEAILFQIIWQVAYLGGFDLAESFKLGVSLIEIGIIPLQFFIVFWDWEHVDVRLSALLGIPSALTSLIGVEVLVTFNELWLRRGLGLMLLLTYIALIIKRRWAKPDSFCGNITADDLLTFQTFMVSVLSGLGGGLFAITGPPLIL